MSSEAYIGVDVSKDQLEVKVIPENEIQQYANDEVGIKELIKCLKRTDPKIIVFESTGGLEMPAVSRLVENHMLVVVVNPPQIRDFAKATGRLAKTDYIRGSLIHQRH